MKELQGLMRLRHILARSSLIGSLVAGVPLESPDPGPARAVQAGGTAQRTTDAAAVKAAFLYNFVRFTTWPALADGAPIVACIIGDGAIAAAFTEIGRVHTVEGHRLVVGQPQDSTTWPTCHLLFITDAQIRRSADALVGITTLPILTVSDAKAFSKTSGIIELYTNAGQLRFLINVDAAGRSGLRLSSKLLNLAKVT
jgi:hypothetical protein